MFLADRARPHADTVTSTGLSHFFRETPSGGSIEVALGQFDALVGRGLTEVLKEDHDIQIVASDLDSTRLEFAVTELTPQVVVLDEATVAGPSQLKRLKGAHPTLGIIVLARQPRVTYGTWLFANGASCLSKDVSAADILIAVRISAAGLRLFADIDGHMLESSDPGHIDLTPREIEVLEYISKGQTQAEIAQAMQLGVETIRTHSAHIRRKLNVRTNRRLIGFSATNDPHRGCR